MEKLLDFLEKLEEKNIYYKLNKVREAILVEVTVPGQRWEIEFFADGHIEAEKFVGSGVIYDEKELNALLKEYAD